ncbi:MAG TPA: response regulator [Candidatus Sulfotelmatobacter sp.]|nr:response regulator [Candidatus Sulfotelmatobacter sp.]
MRILVVDDDLASEDLRDFFKARLTLTPLRNLDRAKLDTRLRQLCFELEFVFDGNEALTRYHHSGPYDLVLTDLCHPGTDGVELARAIRRENPTQALAIYTARISPGPFLDALWQLRIPAADKLGADQALLELVEDALTSNSERIAECHPVTVQ